MEMSKAAFSIGGNGMKYEQAGSGDISDLVMLRLAYLWEDYGMIRSEIYAAIESSLPEYYQNISILIYSHISAVYRAKLLLAASFMLRKNQPIHPSSKEKPGQF